MTTYFYHDIVGRGKTVASFFYLYSRRNVRPLLQLVTGAVVFLCVNISAEAVFGDVIYTADGEKFEGVVLKTDDDKVVVLTAAGEKSFKRIQIGSITYESDLENLLKTALYAESAGDAAKAFYIYEKAFRLDPTSNKAADGMARLQKALFGDKGDAIVTSYGRYDAPAGSSADSEKTLADNSAETEKALKDFGLIIIDHDIKNKTGNNGYYNKFKIADVAGGSRAYNAGLSVGDSLIEIDGSRTDYMGLYDIAAHLAKKGNAPAAVKIEREVRIWVSQSGQDGSMGDAAGFEVAMLGDDVVVTSVRRDSSADTAGLKTGDIITTVNFTSTKGMGVNDVVKLMKQSVPGYAGLFVQRRIEIR